MPFIHLAFLRNANPIYWSTFQNSKTLAYRFLWMNFFIENILILKAISLNVSALILSMIKYELNITQ